jgi:hypothetical protein
MACEAFRAGDLEVDASLGRDDSALMAEEAAGLRVVKDVRALAGDVALRAYVFDARLTRRRFPSVAAWEDEVLAVWTDGGVAVRHYDCL